MCIVCLASAASLSSWHLDSSTGGTGESTERASQGPESGTMKAGQQGVQPVVTGDVSESGEVSECGR